MSADGRYVAYSASDSQHTQIFVRDTCEGAASGCKAQTTVVSTASDGSAANDDSSSPSISANGRYVAFSSVASNLVENAPAGHQIYLRDTCTGAEGSCTASTQIVSIDANGALTGTESFLPSISASGRFVAFLLRSTQSHAATAGRRCAWHKKTADIGRCSCATRAWECPVVRPALRASRCSLATGRLARRNWLDQRWVRTGRASDLQDKRRRFLRVRWPLTIGSSSGDHTIRQVD